ncbi:MAG: hypothetical protein K6F99_04795 [Lachnospiraceae bacterium]|nr:hypothetical protein [Lachnospiraceae bacterium]
MDQINNLQKDKKLNSGIKVGDMKQFAQENRLVEPVFENQKITDATKSVTRIKYDDHMNIFTSESVSLKMLDEAVREEYAFAQNQKDVKKAKVKGKTKDKRRSEYQKKTSQSAFVNKVRSNLASQRNKEQSDLFHIGGDASYFDKKVETFGMDCVSFLNAVEGDSVYRNKEFLENMHFDKKNEDLTAEEKALKRTELERVMHNILKLDLSIFEYKSNDELVKNDLEAKLKILNSTENLDQLMDEYLEVYDKKNSIFDNDDVKELKVRVLTLNNIREEYNLKLNLINSPLYALLGKTQLDSLSDEDIEQRINSVDFRTGEQKERMRGTFYNNLLKLRNLHKKKYGFKEGASTKDMLAGVRKQNKIKDPQYEKLKAADNDVNLYLKEDQTVLKSFGNMIGDTKNYIISANSFKTSGLMDIKSVRDKKIRSIYKTLGYKDKVKDKAEIEKEIESIHKNYAKNKAYAARLGEIRDLNRAYVNDFANEIVKRSLKNRKIEVNDDNMAEEGRDLKVLAAVYSRLHFRDNRFDNNIDMQDSVKFFDELTGVKAADNEAAEAVKERQNAAFKKVFGMVADYDLDKFSKYTSIDQLMREGNMQDLCDLRHMAEMAGVTKKILRMEGKDAYEGLDEKTRQQFDSKLEFFESMFVYMGKSALVNANPISLFISDEMKQSLMSGAEPLKINKKYGDKILERNQGLNDLLMGSDTKQDAEILQTFITINGGLTTKDGFSDKLSIAENMEQFELNKKYEPILNRLKEFNDDRSRKYDDRRFEVYLNFLNDTNIDDLLAIPEKFISEYAGIFDSLCLMFIDSKFMDRIKNHSNYASQYYKIQTFNHLATKYSSMKSAAESEKQNDYSRNEVRIQMANEGYRKNYSLYVKAKENEDLFEKLKSGGAADVVSVLKNVSTMDLMEFKDDAREKLVIPFVKLLNQRLNEPDVKTELEKQGNPYTISVTMKALKAVEKGEPAETITNIWKEMFNVLNEDDEVQPKFKTLIFKEANYQDKEIRSHKEFFEKEKNMDYATVEQQYKDLTEILKNLNEKLDAMPKDGENINATRNELLKQKAGAEEYIQVCIYEMRFGQPYRIYDSKSKNETKERKYIGESLFRYPVSLYNNPVVRKMDKKKFNLMISKLTSGTIELNEKNKSEKDVEKFEKDNREGLSMYIDVIAENYERLFMKYGPDMFDNKEYFIENIDRLNLEVTNPQVDARLLNQTDIINKNTKKGRRLIALTEYFYGLATAFSNYKQFFQNVRSGQDGIDSMYNNLKTGIDFVIDLNKEHIAYLKENPDPMFLNGYNN